MEIRHVAARHDRPRRLCDLEPGSQPAEGAFVGDRVTRERDGGTAGHGWFLDIDTDHDDDAIADVEEPEDRMVEQRATVDLLGELVAAESSGAPPRQHDPGDAISVVGRRDPFDSARRRTRTVP